MSLPELFIIAIGLSMDAFSVAICKGLSIIKVDIKKSLIVALYFGIFQAGMPLIGYFLGIHFKTKITTIDHYIALVLLVFIGINMIRESIKSKNNIDVCSLVPEKTGDYPDIKDTNDSLDFKNMCILAIATSIDALAVGVTFAFLKVNITLAVSFIGITTFILSIIGVKIGNLFGSIFKSKAEFTGGLILILIGSKIFLNHIGVVNF